MDEILDPKVVITWLQKCCKHDCICKDCPYDKTDYEEGCGKLLADAAQLLAQAYPEKLTV